MDRRLRFALALGSLALCGLHTPSAWRAAHDALARGSARLVAPLVSAATGAATTVGVASLPHPRR